MENGKGFRSSMFGGFKKQDVMDYIEQLQNELNAIKGQMSELEKEYAAALMEDSKEPLRGEGNVQFNINNLIDYHNFGLLEPNAAAMSMTE